MHLTLINPPIIDKKYNFTHSVDIPLGLAYLAAYLREKGHEISVIDALGEGLSRRRAYKKGYVVQGLSNDDIVSRIPGTDVLALSIRYSTQHDLAVGLLKRLSELGKTIVVGGPHATYHPDEFLQAGADFVVLGEGEIQTEKLMMHLQGKLELRELKGIIHKNHRNTEVEFISDLDKIPFPARELFPIENYYKERLGFGPSNQRYTSITSSRGCPNKCSFCTSAVFWKKWRKRSAENVLDEIEYCVERLGVRDFHFIDDNLTLEKQRAKDIFQGIIDRKLSITWGATNGVRPEHLDISMLRLMKKSGCVQVTFAPESGSVRLLKEILNKHIDLDKVAGLVADCNRINLRTAAYIIVGAIGETEKDRHDTLKYVRRLSRAGLDEIGVFPLIPYPESPIAKRYGDLGKQYKWEELCTGIIPDWYPNYHRTLKHRHQLYRNFLITQAAFHPEKCIRTIRNLMLGRQETKTDRVLKNALMTIIRELGLQSRNSRQ